MARVEIELPERFAFRTVLPVRVTDLNFAAHVGHDRLLSLAHEARAQLFAAHGWSELDVAGVGIVIADVAAVYLAEARYGMTLVVEVAVTNLRTRACDLYYRLTRQDTGAEIARAKTGIVFLDYRTGKVAHLPQVFREAFAAAG
ncbi:acyl-CoA thioesterase [Anaeromyxobacter diazotrophicus]|uniref:Thioesterase n=1 Tax=Anaeromyxobacter diazotrophicus TaxID=2590199 RepID=A0A7I9VJ82_9BACT|nr:thioesterase family protein [Anaeromyxobacter diazotrophicus]GEJ56476.1 thioesterase [Anaeromyxobacter diazotrophicus]